MARVRSKISDLVRSYSNVHIQGEKPNIFLLATPRSGSTWLMELLHNQPKTKLCSEPLNLRNPNVRDFFGRDSWEVYYEEPINPKLEEYFERIIKGDPRMGFLNPFPFHRYKHRMITDRIVFKVLHGLEDRVDWLRERFQAEVILLLRHPIAVSLSREVFPKLEAYLQSDYARHFNEEQLALAREVLAKGSKMEKGMVSWCMQNAVALKLARQGSMILTYEQLTLEPENVLPALVNGLGLDQKYTEKMMKGSTRPSSSTSKSDEETQKMLKEGEEEEQRRFLVEKWRKKISEEEEEKLMSILDVFGIDVYRAGSFLPTENYWQGKVSI